MTEPIEEIRSGDSGSEPGMEDHTPEALFYFLIKDDEEWAYSKKQFEYLAFGRNSRRKPLRKRSSQRLTSENLYRTFYIKKANWRQRVLREPCARLKELQKWVLRKVLNPLSASLGDCCTWFRKGYSVADNAKPHTGKKFVLKLDLKDFFPSIDQSRVYRFFRKHTRYGHLWSSYMSWLCTYDNQLPQGAPSSPMLANLIASNMDHRITSYLSKAGIDISYTRYADDITLSGNRLPFNSVLKGVIRIIESEWFIINYEKLRSVTNRERMVVTWVVVNETTSVWSKAVRILRTAIHLLAVSTNHDWVIVFWNKWRREMRKSEVETPKELINSIRWYLNYARMLDGNGNENVATNKPFYEKMTESLDTIEVRMGNSET